MQAFSTYMQNMTTTTPFRQIIIVNRLLVLHRAKENSNEEDKSVCLGKSPESTLVSGKGG